MVKFILALGVVLFAIYWQFSVRDQDHITSMKKNEKFTTGESLPSDPVLSEKTDSNASENEDSLIDDASNPVSLPYLMQKQYDGRELTLGKKLEENSSYTRYAISYKSGALKISGIMNVPKGDGPFPVLVLNHGYIDPAIYTSGRGLKREQEYLTRQGYVVIHPDYRNHADSDKDPGNDINMRLGYIEDVINVVYAVKSSSFDFVDKENIGMLGHSMGGGVTLNIMVIKPDLVKAYGLFAPISADNRENYYRWTADRPEVAQVITAVFGSPEKNPEFWDDISPRTFISRVNRPVMLHHGTKDADVPYEWSTQLTELLEDNDKDIEFYTYPGEGHEFAAAWPTVMQRTVEFMDKNLKAK